MTKPKHNTKPLTFSELIEYFRSVISDFPDARTGSNKQYSIEDAALGAFSVFFTQNSSFLAFQKYMQETKGKNNAQSLFGIFKIPSDNQIRNLLDVVSPSYVFPVFSYIFKGLEKTGHIDTFRSYNNDLLFALDATQFFSSNKIHCKNCTQKNHKGDITYSHSVITPVIVAPGNNKVIALEPEFITPQDGHRKQDCENAAAKRWLQQYAQQYKDLGIAILGDDLYCKQPLCELILKKGFNFILVCKPDSHKTLYEWVAGHEIQKVIIKRWTGKRHEIDIYRFVNQVPLRDSDDALKVNWCELTTTLEDGTILFRNAFATNHEITKTNVAKIVKDGRARWKIENENNNTLKTKGYNFEHNYGHGKNYLSSLLATLNILALLFHTLLDIMDKKYRLIRIKLPTRKTFFDDIRALTRYIYFDNWDDILDFMMRGLEIKAIDSS